MRHFYSAHTVHMMVEENAFSQSAREFELKIKCATSDILVYIVTILNIHSILNSIFLTFPFYLE